MGSNNRATTRRKRNRPPRNAIGGALAVRPDRPTSHAARLRENFACLRISSGQTGTFSQSGGTVVAGTLSVGSDASPSSGSGIGMVTVSGGTLSIGTLIVSSSAGGVGTLNISGSANVSASTTINAGTINNSGGVTNLGTIGGSGTVNVTGGTVSATQIRQTVLSGAARRDGLGQPTIPPRRSNSKSDSSVSPSVETIVLSRDQLRPRGTPFVFPSIHRPPAVGDFVRSAALPHVWYCLT